MAELDFRGRVAIVTGAGGGIGKQHALLLASRGAQVVVNDLGGSVSGDGADTNAADSVAEEIRDAGGDAVSDGNTVSTPDGGGAIVQKALDAYGRIDIVVNNAGILKDKTFHNMEPELLNPVLDVHLRGAFYVTRPAWIQMREQRYGRIVNTSSNSGILGNFGQSNYGAAKMGLLGLTRVLAAEGARYNVKVNAVAPMAITRMTEQILTDIKARLDPDLVSPLVAYLVHDEVPVSGEIYTVGGGRVARFFIGMTKGYYKSDLTIEDIRDHFPEIRDETGYTVPATANDELAIALQTFRGL
jgi:NAD(P)-dependent dehydrogenase (short-subunit alcohol dehydrogenase family)